MLSLYRGSHDLLSIPTPRPEGEGVVIDDKSWQPWYECYIPYLIGPTSGATHTSGLSNHKQWSITFKPWLLPRMQG